ncbi:hypothetical protein HOLleu_15714 [Holothuria leucospilota]|uniref:Uncharacterized protein n=1 Tax=Holothuria leucospilota TaxID=206669 RepID=A0A9Q1HAL4_HOLLE|nr:hypothetical protein HOLleu_15714 [Holothuria leucospilota]
MEHQSRRVVDLEATLNQKTLRENLGMPPCSSHGGHSYTKQRRDYYFRKFMESMMELWSLQRQDYSAGNVVNEGDENIPNDFQIKTLLRDAEDCMRIVKEEEKRFKEEYEAYKFKNQQDCIVYRTLWFPQCMPVTEKLDFRQAEVSLGGGEIASFEKATIQYINQYFEENGVFRVPPFCFFTDKISISKKNTKKDLTLLSDEELRQLEGVLRKEQIDSFLAERNADRAVERVVNVLQQWAEKENDNMFIFTNYKYKDYLNKVKSIRVTDIKGDHDIMAISERHGVFFFQVKSCEPTENELNIHHKISFAFYQTMKDKFVFLQSNRDLSYVTSELPIYGFATLPNLTQDDVDKHFLCLYHMSSLLIETPLRSVDKFSKWIRRACSAARSTPLDPSFTHKQFRELCGRYVGLASSVTVPTVYAGIHKTGQKLRLNFLTPVQRRVCDCKHNFVIISGDSGSGKSLILAAKTRQILREVTAQKVKCHVNIVTCTDINDSLFCALKMSYQSSQQLEKYLRGENNITVSQFRLFHEEEEGPNFKVTPRLLVKMIQKLTVVKDGVQHHVLMDEVPFELLKQSQWHLDEVTYRVPPGSNVWLTVSTHTYRVDSRSARDPCWIKEYMPTKFHFEYLDFVKRVPMSLFKVIKEIQAITGDGHGGFSKCGHVIEGPKPLLYRLQKCTCQEEPMMDYMRCQCVDERVYETIKRVFRDLQNINDKQDITIVVHNLAISGTSFQDLKRLLNGTFAKMGIPLVWSTVLFKSSDQVETGSLTASDKPTLTLNKPGEISKRVARSNDEIVKSVQHGTVSSTNHYGTLPSVSEDGGVQNRCHTKVSVTKGCDEMKSDDVEEGADVKDTETSEFKDFQHPIMVVDIRTFIGCEGKILISLDQCGMFQHFPGQGGVGWHRISLVRCVAQYIYVTWPEQEAAQNWRKYISEYETDVFSRDNLTEEQLDFRKNQIRQGMEASYHQSCLEKLLTRNLFEEKYP